MQFSLKPLGLATLCLWRLAEGSPLVERNIDIKMRDNVVLRADVYRPDGVKRYPVLVYRTPYSKDRAATDYRTHWEGVSRGYVVVLQDVRGRYQSEGLFTPYRNEGADGYDTIEWAARQPWSNGQVGTYGLSYPGAVQWLAAIERPPHLVAMVPAMTYSSPRNFFYMNGIFDLSWLPWIYTNIAPDARRRLNLPGIRDSAEAEATWPKVAGEYYAWRPLKELPYLRTEAPYYYEWLDHPPEEAWWNWAEVRGRYREVAAAVLNLSGWYDDAYGPEGAVTNFHGLLAARAKDTRTRTHLILGPWVHGVSSTGERQTGILDFGPAARIDYDDVVLDFFDHHIYGKDNEFARGAPVRYFVMGANEWREDRSWPPPDRVPRTLYLVRAKDDDRGRLQAQRPPSLGTEVQSSFDADPRDPVVDPYPEAGPHDYQELTARKDVLTFDSPPLESDLLVAGAIEADLYVSCDCRDFDLWVRVQDVYPDGRAINLMSPGNDVLRASYRVTNPNADSRSSTLSRSGRKLLRPGRIYRLQLSSLLTSNLFAKGHRVRAQISASFAPHLSSNLQTGESEANSALSRQARIRIHHGGKAQSRLVLPVLN